MPQVTSYTQGTPSWIDLSTTDTEGALAFYSALFGWENDPQEMGPDAFYYMQRLGGHAVCGLYLQMEDQTSQGVPSHWTTYITVENADDAAARAEQAGGTVLAGPFDVFEAGRMAMLQDPEGAVFAVWQPKLHIGCEVKGDPGTLIWNEVMTNNPAKRGLSTERCWGQSSPTRPWAITCCGPGAAAWRGCCKSRRRCRGVFPAG